MSKAMHKNQAFQRHMSSKCRICPTVYEHAKCYFYHVINTVYLGTETVKELYS